MNYAEMCKMALESTKPNPERDSAVATYAGEYGVNGIPLAVADASDHG